MNFKYNKIGYLTHGRDNLLDGNLSLHAESIDLFGPCNSYSESVSLANQYNNLDNLIGSFTIYASFTDINDDDVKFDCYGFVCDIPDNIASSKTEYEFYHCLISNGLIPYTMTFDDVCRSFKFLKDKYRIFSFIITNPDVDTKDHTICFDRADFFVKQNGNSFSFYSICFNDHQSH